MADLLHQWLIDHRPKVPEGSAPVSAIGYSLNRWAALTRYIDNGDLPIYNNWVENQIRPISIGRNNRLFAVSLRAGKRAAAITTLVHSARLNGHDAYAYLRDILERLPTQPASRTTNYLRITGVVPRRSEYRPSSRQDRRMLTTDRRHDGITGRLHAKRTRRD